MRPGSDHPTRFDAAADKTTGPRYRTEGVWGIAAMRERLSDERVAQMSDGGGGEGY